MQKAELLRSLYDILDFTIPKLSSIQKEDAQFKHSEKGWSKIEVLGHLVDSALNNHRRFINSRIQHHLVFDGYAQDDWVKVHNYQDKEWKKLVHFWSFLNEQIISVIQSIPEESLFQRYEDHNFNRICWKTIDRSEKSNLAYLFMDYIGHLEHHLSQILDDFMPQFYEYSNSMSDSD